MQNNTETKKLHSENKTRQNHTQCYEEEDDEDNEDIAVHG